MSEHRMNDNPFSKGVAFSTQTADRVSLRNLVSTITYPEQGEESIRVIDKGGI